MNMVDSYDQQPAQQYQLNESHGNQGDRSRLLKPLKVPSFNGDKQNFEDFWVLFKSLVDESAEPANLKMARLTRSNDIHVLEKFADLVRITVVKLQAEGKDGELGDETLHSIMVKKLPDRQLENYSRWLNERARQKSVIAFRDWLEDEVRFRVEAAEMANGIEPKTFEHVRPPRAPKYPDLVKMRNSHTAVIRNGIRNMRSPCSLCLSLDHGVWFCKQFHDKRVDDHWQFT